MDQQPDVAEAPIPVFDDTITEKDLALFRELQQDAIVQLMEAGIAVPRVMELAGPMFKIAK